MDGHGVLRRASAPPGARSRIRRHQEALAVSATVRGRSHCMHGEALAVLCGTA
jgi:hypothetical protein